MVLQRMSIGLDVHARSIVGCAIDEHTGEVTRRRFGYEIGEVLDWARGFPQPAAVAYEAGPTGFGLARASASSGIECVVAAPSKLQRPAGDRVKTDSRDALHLARLLRLGEIVPVRIPSIEQETARDLVRSRDDNRGDLMAARHRLSKLLLRHGIVYDGRRAWSVTVMRGSGGNGSSIPDSGRRSRRTTKPLTRSSPGRRASTRPSSSSLRTANT